MSEKKHQRCGSCVGQCDRPERYWGKVYERDFGVESFPFSYIAYLVFDGFFKRLDVPSRLDRVTM